MAITLSQILAKAQKISKGRCTAVEVTTYIMKDGYKSYRYYIHLDGTCVSENTPKQALEAFKNLCKDRFPDEY